MLIEISDAKRMRKQIINTDAIASTLYDDKSRKMFVWFIGEKQTTNNAIVVEGDNAVELASILSVEAAHYIGEDFGLFKKGDEDES
ncbi:MAG: hypothetical protein NXI32_04905 [bacterium]|nr:hypothetical protein [bacterium]